jgi:hypothetical protein
VNRNQRSAATAAEASSLLPLPLPQAVTSSAKSRINSYLTRHLFQVSLHPEATLVGIVHCRSPLGLSAGPFASATEA